MLTGIAVLLLARPRISSQPGSSWNRIYRAIRNPRQTYARWRFDRETGAVVRLIRDADICLEANEGEFTRTKPLGAEGRPVRAFGKDVLPSSVLPPADTGGRGAVTVEIPDEWILSQQTTNASGTGMEDFALEVATKVKACGFRRITLYQRYHVYYHRVFDGEVPSRKAIDAMVRRQMAIGSGL